MAKKCMGWPCVVCKINSKCPGMYKLSLEERPCYIKISEEQKKMIDEEFAKEYREWMDERLQHSHSGHVDPDPKESEWIFSNPEPVHPGYPNTNYRLIFG